MQKIVQLLFGAAINVVFMGGEEIFEVSATNYHRRTHFCVCSLALQIKGRVFVSSLEKFLSPQWYAHRHRTA
jgi:hypothetical protein